MGELADQVLQFVADAPTKVRFAALARHFWPIPSKTVKQALAGLIQAGTLCYTSHYGSSFIEISYDRPRTVSDHVVLKPPLYPFMARPDQCVVALEKGASFGGGEHPTTRLAIRLIDEWLHHPFWYGKLPALRAIDIGSGSGVLAIVAAKLGLGRVWGIDIDPCAVFEARENIRINDVQSRVAISDAPLEAIRGSFDFVFANLRTPTLCSLRPTLEKKIHAQAMLIFSGCKIDEVLEIGEIYAEAGYSVLTTDAENGWGALCLTRGDFSNDSLLSIH